MFYQSEVLFPGLTRIWDVARTAMYLVEGTEKAVLLDTGVGVGDLKELVGELTDKPVTVLVTHGHVDHAMGAAGFRDVRSRFPRCAHQPSGCRGLPGTQQL